MDQIKSVISQLQAVVLELEKAQPDGQKVKAALDKALADLQAAVGSVKGDNKGGGE